MNQHPSSSGSTPRRSISLTDYTLRKNSSTPKPRARATATPPPPTPATTYEGSRKEATTEREKDMKDSGTAVPPAKQASRQRPPVPTPQTAVNASTDERLEAPNAHSSLFCSPAPRKISLTNYTSRNASNTAEATVPPKMSEMKPMTVARASAARAATSPTFSKMPSSSPPTTSEHQPLVKAPRPAVRGAVSFTTSTTRTSSSSTNTGPKAVTAVQRPSDATTRPTASVTGNTNSAVPRTHATLDVANNAIPGDDKLESPGALTASAVIPAAPPSSVESKRGMQRPHQLAAVAKTTNARPAPSCFMPAKKHTIKAPRTPGIGRQPPTAIIPAPIAKLQPTAAKKLKIRAPRTPGIIPRGPTTKNFVALQAYYKPKITTKSTSPTRLLSLPPEVRKNIFEHVLGGNVVHFRRMRGAQNEKLEFHFICKATGGACKTLLGEEANAGSHCEGEHSSAGIRLTMGLLRTCREVYKETSLLPYTGNTFVFSDDKENLSLREFLGRINAAQRGALRSLVVKSESVRIPLPCRAETLKGLHKLSYHAMVSPSHFARDAIHREVWEQDIVAFRVPGLKVAKVKMHNQDAENDAENAGRWVPIMRAFETRVEKVLMGEDGGAVEESLAVDP